MRSFISKTRPDRAAVARLVADVRRVLNDRLDIERKAQALTRKRIADKLGVHKSLITRQLKGENLTLESLALLMWAMGRRATIVDSPLRGGSHGNMTTSVRPGTDPITAVHFASEAVVEQLSTASRATAGASRRNSTELQMAD